MLSSTPATTEHVNPAFFHVEVTTSRGGVKAHVPTNSRWCTVENLKKKCEVALLLITSTSDQPTEKCLSRRSCRKKRMNSNSDILDAKDAGVPRQAVHPASQLQREPVVSSGLPYCVMSSETGRQSPITNHHIDVAGLSNCSFFRFRFSLPCT